MGGSPHILAHEKSEGATVRDSTPIRKETFLSELTEHGSLIYLSSMCSLLHSRTSQAEVSRGWGEVPGGGGKAAERSDPGAGGTAPEQPQEGGTDRNPASPGQKVARFQRERERVPSGPAPWGPPLGSLTADVSAIASAQPFLALGRSLTPNKLLSLFISKDRTWI